MVESEADTVAGDCVDATGGVAHEGYVAAMDGGELVLAGDGAAFAGGEDGSRDTLGECGKFEDGAIEVGVCR